MSGGVYAPSFIETQFPVSKLSKESYKERKSHVGQTLTSLGKWWGRKPLLMVRAVILGLLMPASRDPRGDLEIFLALMTMDADGLWRRKTKNIPLREVFARLSPKERTDWFQADTDPSRPKLMRGLNSAARRRLQKTVFERMGYDEKLLWCERPEQIDGPPPEAWQSINEHLGTSASNLPELVQQLGERRFGRKPRVGDAFCGGGSIPFEAARLGCDAYGSDLSPVAALLTWAALNIVGGGKEVSERIRKAQTQAFALLDRQVTDWRIEHNDVGWRADAFLYCTETLCPECGWRVPLAPSWVIGEKTRTVARLLPNVPDQVFRIVIDSGVDEKTLAQARRAGTVRDSRLLCPHCRESTSMAAIRGDRRETDGRGHRLRQWESDDLVPRPDDVFQERLHCVRWRLPPLADLLWQEQRERTTSGTGRDHAKAELPDWVDLHMAIDALAELLNAEERRQLVRLRERDWHAEDTELAVAGKRAAGRLVERVKERTRNLDALAKALPKSVYRAVDAADLDREARALTLLRERFPEWQRIGHMPSRRIPSGAKTDEPIRTRGWTHWHHLFTPRQLLIHGLLSEAYAVLTMPLESMVEGLSGLGRVADWDCKLCRWGTGAARESISQNFYNQAFNTLYDFPTKGLHLLWGNFSISHNVTECVGESNVTAADCRDIDMKSDIWITDPPYADAVNYHELSEFFLAWFEKRLLALFPEWYADSKRSLAIQGASADFRRSMVDCYRNLATHMPDDGLQVVMFTHQDAAVWADLTLILWAAGLRVTAAWTVATETESPLKEGNYVQGTVLMVLRKQTSKATAFLDELVPEVEAEVERQLDGMLALDDLEEPNFSDADYQLAAYAAALRVLTQYSAIEDIDIARQLAREQDAGDANPIERIIENAVRTASDVLVPAGLRSSPSLWPRLSAEDKLYLKGLDVESHGDYRAGVYQEFARGFGVRDYRALLRTGKANETRLKTASELRRSELGDSSFGTGLVRHALYATWRAVETEDVAESLTWLRTELPDYWNRRDALTTLLRYLSVLDSDHWRQDAAAARLVAGAVENDHV